MENLIERIHDKIRIAGEKHYTQAIRKDTELLSEIMNQTSDHADLSLPERLAMILHGQSPICIRGSRRNFKNIHIGFVYCGRAGKCECAREATSNSCKNTISMRTPEAQDLINQKREKTVLEVYGATNVSRVEEIKEKRELTNLAHHGVTSYLHLQNVKEEAMMKKHGVKNAQELPWVQEKSRQTNLDRTGYAHPMFNPEIVALCHANRDNTHLAERVSKSKLLTSYKNILSNIPDLIIPAFDLEDYHGVHKNGIFLKYNWQCRQCGLIFERIMVNFENLKCPRCRPSSFQSQPERDIAELIRSWGLEIKPSDKSIINPFELDIVVPEKRVAIEYCGLYWHSESDKSDTHKGKKSTYHLEKLERCFNKGYKLVTIFSDEWINKPSIVINKLQSILGVNERGVGARRLQIREIPWINTQIFLDTYHIQGAGVPMGIRYGAFDHDNKLCAVMTFGMPRGVMELIRFATDGRSYPGVASKLLTRFIRNHNPSSIVSFADRRWSTGDLYYTLGFTLDSTSKPSYSYISNHYSIREHKSHYQLKNIKKKFAIDDITLHTEEEWMKLLDYDRIWDCGNLKFIWNK